MNAGPTSERAYDELKRRILTGEWHPGAQLDPVALARQLDTSQTPVRDALHILTGEGLVATGANEGFHLPPLDAPDLQDLYAWNAQVLLLAIRDWRGPPHPPTDPASATADSRSHAIANMFDRIARRSVNIEHARAVTAANDRLHAARQVESAVFKRTDEELATMTTAFVREERTLLRRLIATYHQRRQRAAADILRIVNRTF